MQPKTQKTEELEATFNELAEQIRRDTGFSSHIADRVKHPAYQEVVGMGEVVLPLIFRYMEEGKGGFWFHPLSAITGADPTPLPRGINEDFVALNIPEMEQAWLAWARQQGYRW